jgi:sugar phosphate isomerase/epimerase
VPACITRPRVSKGWQHTAPGQSVTLEGNRPRALTFQCLSKDASIRLALEVSGQPKILPDRMKKGISTYLFAEEQLTVEQLQSVRASGFDALEIFALKPHFDYQSKNVTTGLAAWLSDQETFLQSLHTPFCADYRAWANRQWLSISETDKIRREQAVDEIRRALEFAEKIPFPLAIVHMGAPEDRFSSRSLDATYYSLETLIPFARARGVKLALENIPNELSALERMRRFLEDARLKEVGICFDVGHSHLQAKPASEIRDGGPWIVSMHVHDNHGTQDEHLLPFDGKVDWPGVLEALDTIEYRGNLILELKAWNRPSSEVLRLASERFDRFRKCQEELQEMKTREG